MMCSFTLFSIMQYILSILQILYMYPSAQTIFITWCINFNQQLSASLSFF